MHTLVTNKARSTDMMKMFVVVRDFLDRYYRAARSDRFHRPKFANDPRTLWFGLTEEERGQVLNMARRDDLVKLEELIIRLDEEDQEKEEPVSIV